MSIKILYSIKSSILKKMLKRVSGNLNISSLSVKKKQYYQNDHTAKNTRFNAIPFKAQKTFFT